MFVFARGAAVAGKAVGEDAAAQVRAEGLSDEGGKGAVVACVGIAKEGGEVVL